MTSLTRWVLDHKPLVVVLWIALAVAGVAAAGPADRAFEQQFTLPGQEAAHHLPRLLYGTSEYDRVRAREVHVLENAL